MEKKQESGLEVKSYSREEAIKSSMKYFQGDNLAADSFISKYALKDSAGNLYELNPDQMHGRLAKEIARVESKYEDGLSEEKVYGLIKDFKYILPQGGPSSGIGNDHQIVSLSNCFVIGNGEGIGDSYGGIMKIDQEQVQLMKRRGGVGHDLSHIRPKGSKVNNSALTSTGIVPFMERYSNSTKEVAQDGRRGALMLSVSTKHPDVKDFIDAKLDTKEVTNANISVKIDDAFMEAVKNKTMYTQKFPIDSDDPQFSIDIDPLPIWDKIVHNAWKSAEPGILFWDTIIKESVPDTYADLGYKSVSTNPCGEIPLCPYDSCRLLAMNLYNYVQNPFTKEAKFDFNLFKEHVHYAQQISDDIITLELEKIDGILNKINKSDPEEAETKRTERIMWENIKHKAKEGRRMGLGVTAEGDMLAGMGIKYGSDQAIEFSTEVHKTLAIEAYRGSVKLAKERGAFEIYDTKREENNPMIQRLKQADPELYEEMKEHGRRNIALLTIAPTGTTSIMTQTTSGIEPVFNPTYIRKKKININDKNSRVDSIDEQGDKWQQFYVFHPKFEEYLKIKGHDSEKLKIRGEEHIANKTNFKELEEIVAQSPYHEATSMDVDWVQKVKMQGAIQKWVDHSISVTVNLPEDIPKEKVGEVYMAAWEVGCKGITVYREGSREGVMETGKNSKSSKRPKELEAKVLRFKNLNKEGLNEDWIAFVGLNTNGQPYEIFTGESKDEVLSVPNSIVDGKIVKESNGQGSHYDFVFKDRNGFQSKVGGISHQFDRTKWNYAKFTSAMLRNGLNVENVVDTLSKLDDGEGGMNSWKSGAIRALKPFIEDGKKSEDSCPTCEINYFYQEGCKTCSCGSACE